MFLSERARYDGKSAIRGGVPICFPQFSGLGSLPKHGLVRTRSWNVDKDSGPATLAFTFCSDAETRSVWDHAFSARFLVTLSADSLSMQFSVRNTGSSAFSFTGALHTYFKVADIEKVSLSGLDGCEYRDAAGGNAIRQESNAAVRFGPEVDRVYHDTPRELCLEDPLGRLRIASSGFADTVVWNPGATLCAQMSDMAPAGYRQMVCVEAAAARLPVTVLPGTFWSGDQTLTVVPDSAS
jgi:glucose-6-phosphate 1-epimerase